MTASPAGKVDHIVDSVNYIMGVVSLSTSCSCIDPQPSLVDCMARHTSKERRDLRPAALIGEWAARIEGAARGRVDRVRNLAAHRNALTPGHAHVRHRIEEHAGIGMLRLGKEFATVGDLDNAAEIHDA